MVSWRKRRWGSSRHRSRRRYWGRCCCVGARPPRDPGARGPAGRIRTTTEAEGVHRNADLAGLTEKVKQGNPKYHEKLAQQGKLFVRDRLALLLDSAEDFIEDGLLVNALAGDLPA